MSAFLCSKASEFQTPGFIRCFEVWISNLPDQSAMGAITFCDAVVSHEPFSDGFAFR